MIPIVPRALPIEAGASFDNVLTTEQLNTLENLAKQATDPGIAREGKAKRNNMVRWLDLNQENISYYRLIADFVSVVNAKHFRFDLAGLYEQLQLARYEEGQTYEWHQDFGAEASSRKLSVTVQLSDPESYEGGDLEILAASGERLKGSRNRGSATVFPAYQLHRVTPVTRGVRHSLVAWISGPVFR